MNGQNPRPAKTAGTLPRISNGVLRRNRVFPPNFDQMLRRLQAADPTLARWLYGAADKIAPSDIAEKERYATLALSLYYMLSEQAFIESFNQLCLNQTVLKCEIDKIEDVQQIDPTP